MVEPYDTSTGRCRTAWVSPRSGLTMQCDRELGHDGECRCAGQWKDADTQAPGPARGSDE